MNQPFPCFGKAVPCSGHFQKLVALLACGHLLSERSTLSRVLTIL